MRTNNRILPYPVLGNFDAVYPLVKKEDLDPADPDVREETVHFDFKIHNGNQKIVDLISEDKAEYMCDIYCEKTHFQERLLSSEPHFEFDLDRKSISGHVGFEFFVVLKESISYTNPGFNEDYAGMSFDLDKGDILAVFPNASYNASLLYEEMYAIGSFIKFKDDGESDYSIDLEDDCIYIKLPHKLYSIYEGYIRGNNDFSEIVLSSLVYSALEYALVNYDPDLHSTKDWADALQARFKSVDKNSGLELFNPRHAHKIAQLIFQDPYKRLFNQLVVLNQKLTQREEDYGTTEGI